MISLKHFFTLISVIYVLTMNIGCKLQPQKMNEKESMVPLRNINTVKEAHTSELMKLPGVVGVYVGSTDEGQMYIGVMVKKKTPELEQQIPRSLEGYAVRIEETGEIKPM